MRTLLSSTPEVTEAMYQSINQSTIQPDNDAAIQEMLNYQLSPVTVTPRRESQAARAHVVVARVLLGGVALQIFFAGLGVFAVASFLPHAILGSLVILGSLALPLIAWRGHLSQSVQRRSWLVFGLMILQGLLIDAGRLVHLIAAFHPVNAMLLVLFVASLARITRSR